MYEHIKHFKLVIIYRSKGLALRFGQDQGIYRDIMLNSESQCLRSFQVEEITKQEGYFRC